ncbi:MAG: hypothetical protein ABIH87_01315 [bacterium]
MEVNTGTEEISDWVCPACEASVEEFAEKCLLCGEEIGWFDSEDSEYDEDINPKNEKKKMEENEKPRFLRKMGEIIGGSFAKGGKMALGNRVVTSPFVRGLRAVCKKYNLPYPEEFIDSSQTLRAVERTLANVLILGAGTAWSMHSEKKLPLQDQLLAGAKHSLDFNMGKMMDALAEPIEEMFCETAKHYAKHYMEGDEDGDDVVALPKEPKKPSSRGRTKSSSRK